MKLFIVIIAALALAAPASAASPRDPRVPGLQRQVNTLKAQVKSMRSDLENVKRMLSVVSDQNECYMGLSADVENVLWHVTASVVAFLSGQPPVQDLPRWDDKGACSRMGISRPSQVHAFRLGF